MKTRDDGGGGDCSVLSALSSSTIETKVAGRMSGRAVRTPDGER